jgi:hypothetical protein
MEIKDSLSYLRMIVLGTTFRFGHSESTEAQQGPKADKFLREYAAQNNCRF